MDASLPSAAIELREVSKRFGSVIAVDGVSLTVRSGEVCVIVGPSGCGKTTTLKMINRVIEPSAGTIVVRGRDTGIVDPIELRRSIGYVIQHVGLFPHMTVGNNISIPLRVRGVEPAKRRRRALELLELVGLDSSFVDRRPLQLSGGQQQRVGVARALAADPDIVLMDEPLGAVDPLLRPQLQKELKRLQRQLGKTFVVVTHDLGEALTLADRLVVMKGGRVVQEGLPVELLLQPRSDFVREFFQDVRGVPVLRLLTLGDIAEPTRLSDGASYVVHAETRVLTFLETCVAAGRPETDCFTVVSEAGAVLGSISIRSLLVHVAAALTGLGRS